MLELFTIFFFIQLYLLIGFFLCFFYLIIQEFKIINYLQGLLLQIHILYDELILSFKQSTFYDENFHGKYFVRFLSNSDFSTTLLIQNFHSGEHIYKNMCLRKLVFTRTSHYQNFFVIDWYNHQKLCFILLWNFCLHFFYSFI